MRFKRIAIFFIFCANTLLFAHSVIPHHHHNGLVINTNTICCDEPNSHKFNDHSHDNNDDGNCALKQEILIPGRSLRSSADPQNENHERQFTHDVNNVILVSTDPCTTSCSASANNRHYDFSRYLFLLNNSQGLRAPPLS